MDGIVLILIAMVCIAVGIAETVCAATWAPFYFRLGPTVYRRAYEIFHNSPVEIDVSSLGREFHGSFLPSLVFKRIGQDEYAFRETILQPCLLRYVPVMRGHIHIKPDTGAMIVEGRLGWFSMIFPPCFVGIVVLASESFLFSVGAIAAVGLIMGFLYSVQARRFNKVAAYLNNRFLRRGAS